MPKHSFATSTGSLSQPISLAPSVTKGLDHAPVTEQL